MHVCNAPHSSCYGIFSWQSADHARVLRVRQLTSSTSCVTSGIFTCSVLTNRGAELDGRQSRSIYCMDIYIVIIYNRKRRLGSKPEPFDRQGLKLSKVIWWHSEVFTWTAPYNRVAELDCLYSRTSTVCTSQTPLDPPQSPLGPLRPVTTPGHWFWHVLREALNSETWPQFSIR